MKEKLFGIISAVLILGCIAASHVAVDLYGARSVGKLFPMEEITYSLPAEVHEQRDLNTVLQVFQAGNSEPEATVVIDELETFALMETVYGQISLLYEQGICANDSYAYARPGILERYALDGYPDVFVWMFVFTTRDETLILFYHQGTDKILRLESSNLDYYTPEKLDAVRNAYSEYVFAGGDDGTTSAQLMDKMMTLQTLPK